jgi:hypothetical protein
VSDHFGECILALVEDNRVRVDHADPRVLIACDLVHDIRAGKKPRGKGITLTGDILRIAGVNRTVVYRISAERHDPYNYLAEWPD